MRNYSFFAVSLIAVALTGCNGQPTPGQAEAPAASPSAAAGTPVAGVPAPAKAAQEEMVNNDNCGINAPEPGKSFKRSAPLSVWGYAYDKASATVPEGVEVRVAPLDGGDAIIQAAQRGARDDVAKALGNSNLTNLGFGTEVDVSKLSPGRYMVSVIQQIGGKSSVCNNPLPITLE